MMLLHRVLLISACCALSLARDFKSRSGYGTAFEEVAVAQASEDWWVHTIQIPLPRPIWRDIQLNLCKNLHNNDLCDSIVTIQKQMNQMQARTRRRLDESYEQIKDIFPQQPMFKVKNRAIGSFDYASEVTHVTNSITEHDIKTLQEHIKAIEQTGENLPKGVHIHDNPFSSVNKRQIADIYKLMDSIQKNHKDLESYADFFTIEFSKYSAIVSVLIDVFDKLDTLEEQVDQLYDHLSVLQMGKISPLLVTPTMMREILDKVKENLGDKHPSFQLAFDDIDYYYKCRDIFFMRHNDNIYITIKFPIISKHSLLHVYKMETFPIPLDPTGKLPHSTHLIEHADFLAVTEDRNYYALLSSAEMAECGGTKLRHCPFPIPLKSVKEPSCEYKIFNDDPDNIETACDFRFVMEHVNPTIKHLSATRILLINVTFLEIRSDTTNQDMNHQGCQYCIIEVPCGYYVKADQFYMAPSITDCRNHTETRTFFPTNLAALKHLTDHRAKRELRGDTMLAEPLMFQLPNMDIFNSRYSESMANDKKEHLSLKKVAESVRKGEPVYMNLAERILNGDIALVQPWYSVSTLCDIGNFALAIISGLFSIYLFYKMRELRGYVVPASIADQHKEHKGPVSKMF